MQKAMRAIIVLTIALLTAAGLVGGAVFIGFARLERTALHTSAAPAPHLQEMPKPAPMPSEKIVAGKTRAEPAIPAPPPTPHATIDPAPAPTDGSILLLPAAARIHGYRLKIQSQPRPVIRYWVDNLEYVEWPMACPKAGQYDVEITYSCAPDSGGEFSVTAGASSLRARAENTGDWQTFRTVKLGTLAVANDHTTISLRPTGSIRHALMEVQSIKLTPKVAEPAQN